MKMFEVGGCVRDEIMGVPSKDIDFSVVLEDEDFPVHGTTVTEPEPYDVMVRNIMNLGIKVIRDKDGVPVGAEFLTVRGIAPKHFPVHPGRALDFVLSRKESSYTDGRRPDSVEVGTLEDDLNRRDFTMNAIAKDIEGNLIDPHNGVQDINDKVIRAVGSAQERLEEDALRAVRALRFSVTKDMRIDPELKFAMQTKIVLDNIVAKISDERISDELSKMFRFDTLGSLAALQKFPALTAAMFAGKVSIDSTMKQKGRGQ
jgi:tRNA nucleotidyltransferase (CCA-adding enzyme)